MFLDDERQYFLAFNGISQNYFHYNTKLVDPSEFKSYWDLLHPKWKGRILLMDPLMPGTDGAVRFLYHTPALGPEFLRRLLVEMDVAITRDLRQFVDWLASGRFAIAGFQSADRSNLGRAKAQGLPVNWFEPGKFKEGVPLSTSSGNIGLLNKAPHPNAAAVFINWLLSREGQISYQKMNAIMGSGKESLRTDIPKNDVPSQVRRLDGVKYAVLTDANYMDLESVFKFVREVQAKK